MSIEDTLKERITQMSADVQGGPSLQRAIQQGRTRRRRRAVARVGSGVASVCAVGVIAGAAMSGLGPFDHGDGQAPVAGGSTLAVPGDEMVGEINDAFYAELPGRVDVPRSVGRAYDQNLDPVPEPEWARAVNWDATFSLPKGERVEISVLRSESAASSAQRCREDARTSDSLHCDFSVRSDGSEVLESDRRYGNGDGRRFERQVEVRSGGQYLVRVEDVVRASTYEQAEAKWTLDLDEMSKMATDHGLLEQRPTDHR
ncbi:hypothetical protein MU582_21125 [Nocardioidaceae bacterium SCSIO 66511]|nr:hypothetical protein MU582_21125 [Nocardioidaceae bacterium SCSIO 66511]